MSTGDRTAAAHSPSILGDPLSAARLRGNHNYYYSYMYVSVIIRFASHGFISYQHIAQDRRASFISDLGL